MTSTIAGPEDLPETPSAGENGPSAGGSADGPGVSAVAASVALRADNRQRVLAALRGAERLSGAELDERTGLVARTRRDVCASLMEEGLVEREGRSLYSLSLAGRLEAGAELPGLAVAPTLDRAVALLPAEGWRAFCRLLLSNVIARHHLRAEVEDRWGAHIAVGPTKTGKTALAHVVVALFGLDAAASIRLAPAETEGSLWFRRQRTKGGMAVEVSEVLGLPFLCVDEFDKAPPELRTTITRLLQGRTRIVAEGRSVDVAPVVMVCANGAPSVIRSEYRRRAVVLNTAHMQSQLRTRIHGDMRAVMAVLPRLRLERWRPPARALPPQLHDEMLEALYEGLTEAGAEQFDDQAVALMALGRAPLMGTDDLRLAAFATAFDYLTCARSVDEATPRTPWAVSEALGADAALRPNLLAAQHEATVRQRAAAKADEDSIELARRRAEFVTKLRQWEQAFDLRRWPQTYRPEASGLRAGLAKVRREKVEHARTASALEEARSLATLLIQDGRRLFEQRQAEQRQAEARARQAGLDRELVAQRNHDARAYRRQLEESVKAAKREASAALDELRELVKQLERWYRRTTTKPDEHPLVELVSFRIGTEPLLRFVEDPAAAKALASGAMSSANPGLPALSAALQTFTRRSGAGWYVATFDEQVRFAGTWSACPGLECWGDATRAVLAPALGMLRAEESRLEKRAGRLPRAKRLELGKREMGPGGA